LLIVPPSEGKRPPAERGSALDLGSLSFPSLTPTRRAILEATIETSGEPDAAPRFHVGPTVADEVRRNALVLDLPTMPAADLYRGPFYEGLDAGGWSAAVAARAERQLVITSALWGALRPSDAIPPYRLHVCSRLLGIAGLEPTWREVLPDALAEAAGSHGVVVDLRTPTHQAMGRPTDLAARTVAVRVADASGSASRIGDVVSKRRRGEVARELLEVGMEPDGPEALAAILGERWSVHLTAPTSSLTPWTLTVVAD
jgi:cytoplasmic iron level regulating protein YaaA (DUF328/UPF0246 family)